MNDIDELIRRLSTPSTRQKATIELHRLGHKALARLLEVAKDESQKPRLRTIALRTAVSMRAVWRPYEFFRVAVTLALDGNILVRSHALHVVVILVIMQERSRSEGEDVNRANIAPAIAEARRRGLMPFALRTIKRFLGPAGEV